MKSIATTTLLFLIMLTAGTVQAQTNANSGFSSPPQYQPFLKQLADDVSADYIEDYNRTLADFDNRHTMSDTTSNTKGIGAARRWIKAEFDKISEECGGCLEVFYVSGTVGGENRIPDPVEIVNVVAVQRGTADPSRVVMMTGDIDSRASDVMDAETDSPGANDNASGMAGTIEAARVLSKHDFSGTIVYAGLSGEEQGLFGGQILADYAIENEWRIQAVLNNDMIGNIEGINGIINNTTARVFSEGTRAVETEREARIRRFTGGEVDSPSRNLARYIHVMGEQYIDNLDVMMIYRLDRFGRGGHHRPFNDVGFPAVRIMETNENYNWQHQDIRTEDGIEYGDVIEHVDFDYAAKLTALNVVSLAGMAKAPAPPSNVEISGAVRPSTTLNWDELDSGQNPHLEGYKVYWRLTTSPVWTHGRLTGDVSEYTLENIVIDNYYFGVASVSEEGYESPVVFPGPAGSFDR
ncbi:M28 family metallopeptidase [Rhodohalobacter barkolensis]|uniref:Peptidase M28 n=1 Tax=Rhodohalobacter barkolensis TaxID=2053187 RepID=A0A2N0VE23_9BACT|nr:M28 family metallopeptidase [Rhodohalobacter barkolensis]PKD42442.1 peptidase M28 [Rhodohalobacter barkolensis]